MRPSTSEFLSLVVLVCSCGRTDPRDYTGARGDAGAQEAVGLESSEEAAGLPLFDCSAVASQQFDGAHMDPFRNTDGVKRRVEDTLGQMSPVAKYLQMMGVDGTTRNFRDIQRSLSVQIAGGEVIRGYRYRDAGRGVNLDAEQDNRPDDEDNFSTAFPTASLRAASWDLDLEKRVGAAIGEETAASLNNALMAPCMNSVRHPYWGRTQETYGEDSYHIGRMATAMAVGIQEHVVGCAKHFLGNNIERERAVQNAVMTEQTLREIYGRHFEMVVQDGGIGCVMAAYNAVNGVKSTQNQHLLRGLLKAPLEDGGMGFEGFVITDWWAMPGELTEPDALTAQADALEALSAGTDIEVPWTYHYNEATLANADQELVDEAVRRILTQKYRFESALDTDSWGKQPVESVLVEGSLAPNLEHEALAEEAALKSMVLLENGLGPAGPVLPFTDERSIAVVGPNQFFELVSSSLPKSCPYPEYVGAGEIVGRDCLFQFAVDPALGDRGSGRVNADPERTVGPFQGLQQAAGSGRSVRSGSSAEDARDADAVVVVVGYTPGDEGEEYPIRTRGDRSSLDLPPGHNELVTSVLDLNKPTVIVIESGSIVNVPWLSHQNQQQATVWAGYPGMRGGAALGRLLFGEANFSGKVPLAWPVEGELPPFTTSEQETAMGYFFGYREFDRRRYVEGRPVELLFPFGHGRSYSHFEYSALTVPCQSVSKEAVILVTVSVTNTSLVDGDEVVMLFVRPPPKPQGVTGERPWKELKSFARVSVAAGQSVTAELPLRISDLRRWEGGQDGRWIVDSGDYTLLIGKDAQDAESTNLRGTLTVSDD